MEGEVIIIEPITSREDGAYIVAVHKNEYIFRQLSHVDNNWYLKPLNDAYPTVQFGGSDSIKGRVISKSSAKGRQIKSYL